MATWFNNGYPVTMVCDNNQCQHVGSDYFLGDGPGDGKHVCPKCGFKTYRKAQMADMMTDKDLADLRDSWKEFVKNRESKSC